MELKKCVRCGCFFATNGDVCCNCASKDKHDIYALNNYIVNSTDIPSVYLTIQAFQLRISTVL